MSQPEMSGNPDSDIGEYGRESAESIGDGMASVLIHNDDETPFDFVIYTLSSVFMLSEELAEHIAITAHNDGAAIVTIRPRTEAEMLMRVALGRAKTGGHPLRFTLEHR